MIGVMSPRLALAGLIRIAILVVAAQLLPALAHAHAAHAHHGAHIAPAAQASPAASADKFAASARHEQSLSAAMSHYSAPASSGACAGCCGTGVGCCCGAVLMIGSTGDLPEATCGRSTWSLVRDLRSGIDPGAPAKPPRRSA